MRLNIQWKFLIGVFLLSAGMLTAGLFLQYRMFENTLVEQSIGFGAPLAEVDDRLRDLRGRQLLVWAAGMIALLVLSYPVSVFLTRPVRRLIELREVWIRRQRGWAASGLLHDEVTDLAKFLDETAAELELKTRQSTGERSRFEAILSSMVEGVLVLDLEARVLLYNRALETMLGREQAGVIGRPLIEVWRHHRLNELVRSVLQTRQERAEEIVVWVPWERIFSIQASVVRAAPRSESVKSEGRVPEARDIGLVLVFHDITEIRRLERIRRDFVANVSHELRTPLTSIKGYVEALLDGAKDDPQKRVQFLETVQRHANNLDRLLADLLELSSIESGSYRWRQEPVPVADLIDKSVQIVRPAADKKRQNIVLSGGAAGTITGDPDKLIEVVVNVLDNAVKYTPEGGRITVEAGDAGDGVEVRISDTGIGIPEKEIPRIFERFYRVDRARSRQAGGTGLGLAIVKHIMEAHNGRISVESRLGQGTRFTLTFPKPQNLP